MAERVRLSASISTFLWTANALPMTRGFAPPFPPSNYFASGVLRWFSFPI